MTTTSYSLGSILYQNRNATSPTTNTTDFRLVINDGEQIECEQVHRIVMCESSPYMKRTVGGAGSFMFYMNVPKGSMKIAKTIVRYMYERNPLLFNNFSLNEMDQTNQILTKLEMNTFREVKPRKQGARSVTFLAPPPPNLTEKTKPQKAEKTSFFYETRSKRQMVLRKRANVANK